MDRNDLINLFKNIRDIHYKIPLSFDEEDNCCSGKSEKLLNGLISKGFKARYRVCVFLWSEFDIPQNVSKIPHDDDCTHTYVEVFLDEKWISLDATWDIKLKSKFKINEWDGKNNTNIAVTPIKLFSPKKSKRIVENQNESLINDDLKKNGKFYSAFNKWLEDVRADYISRE